MDSLYLTYTLPGDDETSLVMLPLREQPQRLHAPATLPASTAASPPPPLAQLREALATTRGTRGALLWEVAATCFSGLPAGSGGFVDVVDATGLVPHGSRITLSLANAHVYIEAVVRTFAGEGIAAPAAAFARGFAYYAPAGARMLALFSVPELDALLGGGDTVTNDALWAPAAVAPHIMTAHGYTSASPQVEALLSTLASLSVPQRRLFLRFLTGSPRLPVGGFAALSPPLTIVRSVPVGSGISAAEIDRLLPTCSTCQTYLKLPPYTTAAVLRARLLLAIAEGQGVFAFD